MSSPYLLFEKPTPENTFTFHSFGTRSRVWTDCEFNMDSGSKTHKRLKERFLTGQNRTKLANFRGSPFFQATYNIKTERKKQLIQLILCHLDVGGWQKQKGTRLTDALFRMLAINSVSDFFLKHG